MTIRMRVLHDMLNLETAAANWFAKMSDKERKTYVAAHPKSKYAKNTTGVLAAQATKMGNYQSRQSVIAGRAAAKNSGRPVARIHNTIAGHHAAARDHYLKAAEHFGAGRERQGHAALDKGHVAVQRAMTAKGGSGAATKVDGKRSAGTRPMTERQSRDPDINQPNPSAMRKMAKEPFDLEAHNKRLSDERKADRARVMEGYAPVGGALIKPTRNGGNPNIRGGKKSIATEDLVDHARRRGMDAKDAGEDGVQATKVRGERPFTRTLDDHDDVDDFADGGED